MSYRHYRFGISLCLLVILFTLFTLRVSNSQGQDATATPEITIPAETRIPTETPTEIPTAAFTETPTQAPTETPTETPTEIPTVVEWPTATEPPILTVPTNSPTPLVSNITVPTLLLNETVELDWGLWNGNGGWTRSNTESAHQGEWNFSDSPAALYAPNTMTALTLTQPVPLPSNAEVYFQYWQYSDLGMGDTAQVQISTDGINWQSLSSETGTRNPAWTVHTIKLSAYAGQSLWLRFVLTTDSDPATVGDGWRLDDISIQALPLPTTPLYGLTEVETDNPALWLAEGNWQPTSAPVYNDSMAWMGIPQLETSVALTLNTDVNLAALAQPELHFWQILNLGTGNDTAQVQLSLDNGQSWLPLTTYTVGNNTTEWAEQTADLSSFAGQTIRLRFLLITDNDEISGTGWTLDAISLQSAPIMSSTATPTEAPTITPTETATPEISTLAWNRYEDTDPLLIYSEGDWQTFAVEAAAGGTLTATANVNATLTIHFETSEISSGIHILYSGGPEGGLFTGQLDNTYVQTADALDSAYSYGHVMVIDGLSAGMHTLILTNNTGAIWIEAIEVQGTLISAPVTIEPELVLAFADNFDTGLSPAWYVRYGADFPQLLVPNSNNGQALHMSNPDIPVRFPHALSHPTIDMQFRLDAGTAEFILNQNENSAYYILISATGHLQIMRDTTVLGATDIQPLMPGTWYSLRLAVADHAVTMTLNGTIILQAVDPGTPMRGIFSIIPDFTGQSAFQIDNVEIRMPEAERWNTVAVAATPIPSVHAQPVISQGAEAVQAASVVPLEPPNTGHAVTVINADNLEIEDFDTGTTHPVSVPPGYEYFGCGGAWSPDGEILAHGLWYITQIDGHDNYQHAIGFFPPLGNFLRLLSPM